MPYEPDTPQMIEQLGQEKIDLSGDTATPAKGYDTGVKLSKEETKARYRRMKVAERYYETEFQPRYEECQRLLKGEHYKARDDHQVVVNVYPHIIETLTHSVTFAHPEIIIKPMDPQGQANQETAEKVAAYDYRKSHAHREARRAFKESRMYNFGVVMVGWEFETDEACYTDQRLPVEGEPPDPQAVLDAVTSGNPPPPAVPKAKVKKDQFYCKRLDPRSFRVSPEATWVVEDMPWCGYVEYRELGDVKGDPRYKNTKNLKGSDQNLTGYFDREKDEKGQDIPTPPDMRRVKLMHYYEKRRRLHMVFCDEHENALLSEAWAWDHDRYPFRLVFNEPPEDQFYGMPPMLLWKHMQQEINHFHTQLAIHIRRFVRKYVARTGAFTEANKKKLMSGTDGTVVETTEDPTSSLVPVLDAQISPDVYNYEAKVMQYLSLLSGIDQYEMSRAPTKRMTQEEVNQVASSGGARAKRAAASFEELCGEIAEEIIAWNQQYAVRTRQLPVVENDQVVDWQGWTKDEIAGEYSFEVYVGSTEIKNKAGQVEELGFLLQSLAPFFGPDPATGQPMLQAKPFLRQFLSLVPDLKDVAAIVGPDTPMPPPGAPMPGGPPGGQDPMAMLAMQGGGMPPQPMLPQGGMPPLGIPGGYGQ